MSDTVRFDNVRAIRNSVHAVLCVFEDRDDEEHWIPLSQVDDDSEVYKDGTEGTLIVTRWSSPEEGAA